MHRAAIFRHNVAALLRYDTMVTLETAIRIQGGAGAVMPCRNIFNKKITYILIVFTGLAFLYIKQKNYSFYNNHVSHWKKSDNISCHYIKTGDALLSAEEPSFSPPTNSIFFHETSCRGGLNSRQACSVESAARAHPHWQVHVLFSAPVTHFTLKTSCLSKLQHYTNVKFARVHISEYAKGTPVESMIAKNPFRESKFQMEHTSDVLRFLTLYKWGGVYLDTDMLVVKPLDSLGKNWAAREDDTLVNVAALALAKDEIGIPLVGAVLREIATSYRPDLWTHNGPGSLNRVLEKTCSTTKKVDWSAATCNGFQVYDRELLYPIHYSNKQIYFEAGELENLMKTHTHHMWNKLTFNLTPAKDSPYIKLAKIYCPTVYEMYGEDFGS